MNTALGRLSKAEMVATAKCMRAVAGSDGIAVAAAVTLIGALAAAADSEFRAAVTELLRSLADELELPPTEAFASTHPTH